MAGIMLLGFSSCKKKNTETANPVLSPVTEAVFAPGHIEAGNQFTLTAVNDGYVQEVPVQEGDTVTSGQVIYRQDNTTAAIQQQSAAENLDIARKNAADNSAVLQQLQEQLNTAKQQLANDKTQRDRMERLFNSGSVARVDYEKASLAYTGSVNAVAALEQNMAATKLSLQQAVINSRSQQQVAAANAGYFSVKSPGNYTVYTLLKKKGDYVRKGDAMATLGQANGMLASLSIDEGSINKISLGQTVLVELNTRKGATYTAKVRKIYPVFDEKSQAYTVEAAFDTLPPQLLNGTLLQANIIVGHKDKALLVPAACVSPDGKAVIVRDGREDTVQLQTGIVANDWVEVVKGVSLEDKLLKAF